MVIMCVLWEEDKNYEEHSAKIIPLNHIAWSVRLYPDQSRLYCLHRVMDTSLMSVEAQKTI